ncbi:MAG: 23S rRNA (uracil(1939)-C(5))-methyltransferase RlmD [Tissierellia bacterium]|nr:23S rRNA (uracil(1939)-C(5))-methyltransferase RlmD [Tissierellia bacterium]
MAHYIEGKITSLEYPNRTTAETEEGTIALKGGIPGQKVALQTRGKGRRKKGKLMEVLEPSPLEIPSPCPNAAVCGGCSYMTLDYEAESQLKKELMEELFKPFGVAEVPYTPSPEPYRYRNKMEYTFGDWEKGGPLTLGLHRKAHFYDIVDTEGCLLVPEDMEILRKATQNHFRERGTSYYHRARHEGLLRHLVIRHSTHEDSYLLNLVTTHTEEKLDHWVDMLTSLDLQGKVAAIYHTETNDLADAIKPEKVTHLYGSKTIEEELLGLKFHVGPFSFFQPNPHTAKIIYKKAQELLRGDKGIVYDLYSGTGTIAQLMAQSARHVYGIEIIQEAVESAQNSAKENGIQNATFLAGDVLQTLENLPEKPDTIIVDPPRDGIHPKAIGKIIATAAPQILYISCNPKTMARDLNHFQQAGYNIQHLEAIDQFPHTVHVETVVLMSRK